MNRREALKKLAIGSAVTVGATSVLSKTAFAYGEPYNVSVSMSLDPGAEGGSDYRNSKIGIDLVVNGDCRASSPYTNDEPKLQHPTSGTDNQYNLSVTAAGNNSSPHLLYFNYVTTSPSWGNGSLNKSFSGTGIAYSGGLHFTVRKTVDPSSLSLSDYRVFNTGERIGITFEFRLRCSSTQSTKYRYSGYISFNGTGTSTWSRNMSLSTY